MKLKIDIERLKEKIAEEPEGMECEAGIPVNQKTLPQIIDVLTSLSETKKD